MSNFKPLAYGRWFFIEKIMVECYNKVNINVIDKKFYKEQKMDKLAKMAKLKTKDAEKFQNDIANVIKMAEDLNEIGIEADMAEEGVLREDEIKESFEKEEMLKNASVKKDGYIIVPKIVGE